LEAALLAAAHGARERLALRVGFAHIPLLLGVVITAAGIHTAVVHPGAAASWPAALALAGGIAMSLAGIAEIRHTLHTAPARSRLITAAAVLATIPVGALVSAALQIFVTATVLTTLLVID
jgi:low temperature requirement protein LtrA